MLNVKCSKCNKGNLLLPNSYDGLVDYYKLSCTKCNHIMEISDIGMDSILDEHNYNSTVNEDVKILDENGSWVCQKQGIPVEKLNEYLKDVKLIQEMQSESFDRYYFQKGTDFYLIMVDSYDFDISKYRAKEESMDILINHFFKKA